MLRAFLDKVINLNYRCNFIQETSGVIKLLRKGTKAPTLSTNYKSIILLSIYHQLASFVITKTIGRDRHQKDYMDNNLIGSCLINLISMMKYMREKNIHSIPL